MKEKGDRNMHDSVITSAPFSGLNRSTKGRKLAQYIKNNWMLYLLLLLPFAYFVVFKYAPMYGVLIAFKNYNIFDGVWASPWNNFDTFKEIFAMPDFWNALRNTFLLNALDLVVGFPAPIILAVMLGEIRLMWFKKATQTILYLPHFLSWVIIGSIALQLFAPESGLVNMALNRIGVSSIPFLNDKYMWIVTYVVLGLWQSIGWNTILYLAAIAGINPELYEAAEMDGAGRLRRIWHVTLPGIRATIVILLILAVGRMTQIGFDRPYVLSNYFVTETADVISTFVFRLGIQNFQYSIATAVGLFQSVVGLVFLLVTNYIADKLGEQGIW